MMLSEHPKVSVIIPTYNRASFLSEAVESVLNQTYSDFEIIIVDDGSTDNTAQVVKSFSDPRIKYIYQENQGLAGARNTGIKCSQADYLAFLDSDDIFLAHKLEVQVQVLNNQPEIGLVAGGFVYIDENNKILQEQRSWTAWPNLEVTTWLSFCPVIVLGVLVRRSWVEHVGLFDRRFRRVEDWDLWLRLAYAGCQMCWVESIVCGYRMHTGQMVRDAVSQKLAIIRMLDKFYATPDLPEKLLALKSQAYANAYVGGACQEYVIGQIKDAKADITQAVQLNPHLLDSRGEKIFNELVASAGHPLVSDPVAHMKQIFANLPVAAEILMRRRREAIALGAMTMFYRGYQSKDAHSVLKTFPLAVVYDPTWLRNRGAIFMWLKSLIGNSMAASLRRN